MKNLTSKPLQELKLKELVELIKNQENCYIKGIGNGDVEIEVDDK